MNRLEKCHYEGWRDQDFDDYHPPECCHCRDVQKMHRDAREFYEVILQALYSKDPLPEDLERWLDECAYYLDVKLPSGDLQIERKNNTLKDIQHYLSKVI